MEKEQAKKLVESFAKVASAVAKVDKNKDGKLQVGEIFELLQIVAVEIFNVYGDIEVGLDQLGSASNNDRHILAMAFAEKFDLENDEAEDLIESVVYFALDGFELYQKFQAHFKGK